MEKTGQIFSLTQEQLELTNKLQGIIISEISNSGGCIPFSRYMELALYHPQLGYYCNGSMKFGKEGDFITASLISSLFGSCICNQILELFHHGINSNILEIGAGNGQLMCDILSKLGDEVESYYIIELSPALLSLQQLKLTQELPQYKDKVVWLTSLPQDFEGIIIGNEVLDAQPCELVRWSNERITTLGVTATNGNLQYEDLTASEEIMSIACSLPVAFEDYVSEISLINRGFIKSLANSLKSGVILLIDYGYNQNEYYNHTRHLGTIRGFFRQHQLDDVLLYPGLIDITASVDFTAIAATGIDNGLDLLGYTTQANFLLNCKLLDEMRNRQQEVIDEVSYLKLSNQVNRLTSPNEMGESFKVIAFSKNLEFADLMGFIHGDKSHIL